MNCLVCSADNYTCIRYIPNRGLVCSATNEVIFEYADISYILENFCVKDDFHSYKCLVKCMRVANYTYVARRYY